MSIQFDDPMNKDAAEMIKRFFGEDVAAMDDKSALINRQSFTQMQMKELANAAKQPVTLEINDEDEIKTMANGSRYKVTPEGWVKIN